MRIKEIQIQTIEMNIKSKSTDLDVLEKDLNTVDRYLEDNPNSKRLKELKKRLERKITIIRGKKVRNRREK